ncbi:MAPEG family protein [Loktanella agnita]|uniref:MAPEG family protein n=1 Tax=Loktanella agnita TaxID=287097 RepID=UPI003989971C
MLIITAPYAAIVALLYLILTIRVIAYRRAKRISLGDKDDPAMRQRIRAHANCAEYAPIGIIMLALVELNGGAAWAVHLLGAMLLLGRIAHAAAFWRHPMNFKLRVAGMLLSMIMIALSAFWLLFAALF